MSFVPRLARFLPDRRAGVAILFAIAAPVLIVLICAAIDLAQVGADRAAMQDAADATALAMAKQLGVATPAGIASRAQAYAARELGALASRDHASVSTVIADDNGSLTVTIAGRRESFFGNLLPPGGWRLAAQATAATLGQMPLCVLSSGSGNDVTLADTSVMTAPRCLVQSDRNIAVGSSAALSAGLAQATGTASGPITPAPQTGSPSIADPFASMAINPPPSLLGLCNVVGDLVYNIGVNVLSPGIHCGNITVRQGAQVVLLPGEHYFSKGSLTMKQNSVLTGSNVVLVFDKSATFAFNDQSQVTLTGRTTGQYAGFVIATTRDNTSTMTISSTAARQLEGAIYIPNATLAVSGLNNTVNDQAAWTVVVAQTVQMSGSANLVVNANYAGSTVPVPAGVGPNFSTGKVMLKK